MPAQIVQMADGGFATVQTTKPVGTLTNTTLNDGGGGGAGVVVTTGSTDMCGSVRFTAGNGVPAAGIAGQIVFHVPYLATPKMVLLTSKDADGTDNEVYVSDTSTLSFQVSFNRRLDASEVVDFYYLVIQ